MRVIEVSYKFADGEVVPLKTILQVGDVLAEEPPESGDVDDCSLILPPTMILQLDSDAQA